MPCSSSRRGHRTRIRLNQTQKARTGATLQVDITFQWHNVGIAHSIRANRKTVPFATAPTRTFSPMRPNCR